MFAPSAFALAAAALLAFVLEWIQKAFAGRPETAVAVSAGLLAGVLTLCVCAALARRDDPYCVSLAFLCALGISLVALYFVWVRPVVLFPGDFLIWSEGDFVNDIVKFRVGYPLYSAQVNNDSFTYAPGAQLLTYGSPLWPDIPRRFRSIAQFNFFTRSLRRFLPRSPAGVSPSSRAFMTGWLTGPFGRHSGSPRLLIATNPITNRFIHNLHNDALAQLIVSAAFLLLLEYMRTRRALFLGLMAALPAAGFLVKQSVSSGWGCT